MVDPTTLSEEELDQALADLEEAERLSKTIYLPYDKQKEFHCATNTIRAVFGGNTLTVYQSTPTTDVAGGNSIFVAEVYTP